MIRAIQYFIYILGSYLFFTSCTKEISQESNRDHLSLGNNCTINTVTPCDSASGVGYGSLHITVNAENQIGKVQWYDSTVRSVYYQADFTYAGDTIKVGQYEYFILDASGRIKELNTLENILDPSSEHYRYIYNYNADGYLVSKNWFILSRSADIPSFVYTYTWLNGNLVKVEAAEATGAKRIALSAVIEYDISREVNNFIYCFPEANELAPYILAINAGKKSKNLLKRIEVKIFDDAGNAIHNYTTEYGNYKFSSDNYITELYATGDIVDGLLIVDGLTKFNYECK